MNGVWDSDMEFLSCCGKLPDSFNVKLDPKVYIKIDTLMQKRQNIEWLTFLLGYIDWNNNYAVIEDLHIPDSQSVTGGNVDDVDCDDNVRNKIIGVMHSHHKMGCFFSGDDWQYLNNNHTISIVVSNKNGDNEFKSVVRVKTPCGSYSHVDGAVSINCEIDKNELDDFMDEIDEKIKFGMAEFKQFPSPYQRKIINGPGAAQLPAYEDDLPPVDDDYDYDEMLYLFGLA